MTFTVSVRDTEILEDALKNGENFYLPEECVPNSEVIRQLLKYAERVLPEFNSLTDREVETMAQCVSYLMRTDFLIRGEFVFGGTGIPIRKPGSVDKKGKTHLSNSPGDLHPGWTLPWKTLPLEYSSRGAELFRCYGAAMNWMHGIYDKLDPKGHSLRPAFILADVTAYLLDPADLVDYAYTPEEIDNFHDKLEKEWREV